MPDCIIQYRPTKEAAELLRNLMSESGSPNQCHIHVALMGSPQAFSQDFETAGKVAWGRLGNDPAFLTNVRRAVEEALLAARAVRTQRDLLLRDRDLRETQDREALASEMEDKRKGQQNPQRTESTFEAATSEESTTLCECLEETVVDTEEVHSSGYWASNKQMEYHM
ncbi:uncharacterized protein [Montipora foliosa]|uniref:uncharacterized protein isoform X2 n=1 Tax=Montipora foliosa TaxID=591990 RepID=UPI0035F1C03F